MSIFTKEFKENIETFLMGIIIIITFPILIAIMIIVSPFYIPWKIGKLFEKYFDRH